MLEKILNRDDVKSFLAETITLVKYTQKEIPNTFCEEKIPKEQYCFYQTMDALIKYSILCKNASFDEYFEQLKRILKKLQTHNDIQTAINRLIVKTVEVELGIKEENDLTNQIVIKYVTSKYDDERYFFHALPSYLVDSDEFSNLEFVDKINQIIKILDQYKINHSLKEIVKDNQMMSYTDSPFMAFFYAYNSPIILYQLCIDLIRKNSKTEIESNDFFYKNFDKCYNYLDSILKKHELPMSEREKILTFFEQEWKKINEEYLPVLMVIKKTDMKKCNTSTFKDKDLAVCVMNILDSRWNDYKLPSSIRNAYLIHLPSLKEILKNTENQDNNNLVKDTPSQDMLEVGDSYGNVTIVAILGVLFIALGVILMIIMIERG